MEPVAQHPASTLHSFHDDTIVAIATPAGRGGIGVVRLSGPQAHRFAGILLDRNSGSFEHARASLAHLTGVAGELIDDVVITAWAGPRSFTGEDTAEISAHGSPVVLHYIVDRLLELGARLAGPGEFSRRALLNGRMDLLTAEAVHDLIAAQTLAQARTAAQQMGGALARRVAPIKDRLLHQTALLEAGLDFAAGELDDVSTVTTPAIRAETLGMEKQLEALLAGYRAGMIQRHGLRLALIGRPNAGKSSLFNALLGRDRAIVTPIAGTTRDTLEEVVSIGGIPVVLVDTAGLRDSSEGPAGEIDAAEAAGIVRSREAAAEADIVLLVEDATQAAAPDKEDATLAPLDGRPNLSILTKADLLSTDSRAAVARLQMRAGRPILTSTVTGEGLDELGATLLAQLRAGSSGDAELNSPRHREAVAAALEAVRRAYAIADAPHEVLIIELYNALRSLDELTGVTTTEDILGRVFSAFCIGK